MKLNGNFGDFNAGQSGECGRSRLKAAGNGIELQLLAVDLTKALNIPTLCAG
jgi:hypothetical protein